MPFRRSGKRGVIAAAELLAEKARNVAAAVYFQCAGIAQLIADGGRKRGAQHLRFRIRNGFCVGAHAELHTQHHHHADKHQNGDCAEHFHER